MADETSCCRSEAVRATFPRVAYYFEAPAQAVEAGELPHEFAAALRSGRY